MVAQEGTVESIMPGRGSARQYAKYMCHCLVACGLLRHCQGVENVYAQHVPLMMTTVEAALKGKLKDSVYPATGQAGGKPQEVSNCLT